MLNRPQLCCLLEISRHLDFIFSARNTVSFLFLFKSQLKLSKVRMFLLDSPFNSQQEQLGNYPSKASTVCHYITYNKDVHISHSIRFWHGFYPTQIPSSYKMELNHPFHLYTISSLRIRSSAGKQPTLPPLQKSFRKMLSAAQKTQVFSKSSKV